MTTTDIETARLILSPFTIADVADVFAYASNPHVARYTTWSAHRTIGDSEAFIHMVLNRGPNQHTWAIRLRTDRRAVGAIEFGLTGAEVAEVHYVLAEPMWNRGLMTEAARAVLEWGLRTHPRIRWVRSRAVVDNIGSQRVMEKCGLRFERTQFHRWNKCAEPVAQREYVLEREPKEE